MHLWLQLKFRDMYFSVCRTTDIISYLPSSVRINSRVDSSGPIYRGVTRTLPWVVPELSFTYQQWMKKIVHLQCSEYDGLRCSYYLQGVSDTLQCVSWCPTRKRIQIFSYVCVTQGWVSFCREGGRDLPSLVSGWYNVQSNNCLC